MKVENKDVLSAARIRTRCEICGNSFYGGLQAIHASARGRSDCKRVDIPCNILSACLVCHAVQHNENRPTLYELWTIAGAREGMTLDEVETVVRYFQELPPIRWPCEMCQPMRTGKDAWNCLKCGKELLDCGPEPPF